MVRGDNKAEAVDQEGAEIDRIMQEIEDLEKKMDEVDAESASIKAQNEPTQSATAIEDNVVPLRGGDTQSEASNDSERESLAETDAVPAVDEPLMRSGSDAQDGSLGLKVGGCAEVSLEFTRAGMTVTLSCTSDSLTITTDQGAEFRIPFKHAA